MIVSKLSFIFYRKARSLRTKKLKKKTAGALAKAQAAKVSAVQNVFLSVSRTNWFRFSNS